MGEIYAVALGCGLASFALWAAGAPRKLTGCPVLIFLIYLLAGV